MFDQFHQKRIRHSFTLSSLLLAMAALLVCSFPAASNAEAPPATAVAKKAETSAASNPKAAPCQGLKPINNLDELLYQFYINLDSDCLFNMTPTELEKIWGIKILSENRLKPGQPYSQLRESSDFDNKPYKSEKDSFYVEASQDYTGKQTIGYFSIKITKAYYEQKGRLFFASKPPESLPPPVVEGDMITGYYLTWFNTDKTRMIFCHYNSPRGSAGIASISIQHTVNPERFKEGAK